MNNQARVTSSVREIILLEWKVLSRIVVDAEQGSDFVSNGSGDGTGNGNGNNGTTDTIAESQFEDGSGKGGSGVDGNKTDGADSTGDNNNGGDGPAGQDTGGSGGSEDSPCAK